MLPRPLAGGLPSGTTPPCGRVSLLRVRFNSLGVGLLDTYAGGFAVFETYEYALVFTGLVPTVGIDCSVQNYRAHTNVH
jgi:hypothetical protein